MAKKSLREGEYCDRFLVVVGQPILLEEMVMSHSTHSPVTNRDLLKILEEESFDQTVCGMIEDQEYLGYLQSSESAQSILLTMREMFRRSFNHGVFEVVESVIFWKDSHYSTKDSFNSAIFHLGKERDADTHRRKNYFQGLFYTIQRDPGSLARIEWIRNPYIFSELADI